MNNTYLLVKAFVTPSYPLLNYVLDEVENPFSSEHRRPKGMSFNMDNVTTQRYRDCAVVVTALLLTLRLSDTTTL